MIEVLVDMLIVAGIATAFGFAIALYHGEAGLWWFGTVFLLPVLVILDIIKNYNSRK